MMKNIKPLTFEYLKNANNSYLKEDKNTIVRHALLSSPLDTVAKSADYQSETRFAFSIDNKTMAATNQKSSGRCWIFAATNLLREIIAKKCKIA
ncbi:MAG TPA: C1 family peptidase, partial [Bacilli bacterium]|nr:C1 family peptidase [Bacilli bacterium]